MNKANHTKLSEACVVEMIDEPAALAHHLEAWNELAAEAIEPNPFYEPFCLQPALQWLAEKRNVRILLIWSKGSVRRLVGLLPVQSAPVSPWLRLEAWMPWQHRYCFLTTPLIHRGFAGAAAQALLAWFGQAGKLTVLSCVGGGAFARELRNEAEGLNLGISQAEQRYRAFFQGGPSADAYIARALSGRHRKGYRRVERHMAAMGKLEYRALGREPGAVEAWINDFLALEASGWKGKAGTAFALKPADRAYFTELIRNSQAAGRLMALGLYLDDRPVAMKANLLTGDGGFCFKICFDEEFAKHSPGVLLELENIREAHRRGLTWMDSCADQDHPMIDRLWPERREIRTVFLSPRWLGVASIAAPLAALRRTKRSADRLLRRYRREPANVVLVSQTESTTPEEAVC